MATNTIQPVYILTGVSRGIGFTTLNYLISIPCYLVTVSRTMNDQLKKIVDSYPNRLVHIQGSIADSETNAKIIEKAIMKFKRIDALIHNAGVMLPILKIEEMNMEEWKKHFDINFFGVVDLTQRAIPHLRTSKGRVIVVSSGAAVKGKQGWGAYCCSKASLNMFTKVLSIEEPNITTIALRPGVINTSMQADIRREASKGFTKEDCDLFNSYFTDKKLRSPEEPAYLIFCLAQACNPISPELNGEFISIDDERIAQYRYIP